MMTDALHQGTADMLGMMMEMPLQISSLLSHAARFHGRTEIVSRTVEGPIHRYTYADLEGRAKQLANVLNRLGVGTGDRVASLAWNGYRHLEFYYGVSGSGAVCHTINPRLFPDQIAYIINHAEDRCLFVDTTFVPLLEALADRLGCVRNIIVMCNAEHMPDSSLPDPLCYETLLGGESAEFDWPSFDERCASSLCYTSGTTGNPKGVLYSHRSTVLHSYAACLPDVFDFSALDVVLPVVPMFHVNAWGIPYSAPLAGTKLVLPGAGMDGASLDELIVDEGVTIAAGVPTLWAGYLDHLDKTGRSPRTLERVVIGGAAAPRSMFENFQDRHGVRVVHGWGMTEMSPVGAANMPTQRTRSLPDAERLLQQVKQGRVLPGVAMKIVDDAGNELPRDGVAFGELKVRGPWVCHAYFRDEDDSACDVDGWFATGDICTLDDEGYMLIVDRSKDLIKSGGEWISSIELENIAVGHPSVAEAAAIAVPHPRWSERPLLVVVAKPDQDIDRESLLASFQGKIPTWWLPDDVVVVDEVPHTATGKILKSKLRETYANYVLPGVSPDD